MVITNIAFDVSGVLLKNGQPVIPVINLCKQLSEKYQIGIITNLSKDLVINKLSEIIHIFSPIIFSKDFGFGKPDPKIYQIYCQKALCQPSQVLLIDDNQINVDSAVTFGMSAYFFTNQRNLITYLIDQKIITTV